jgi:hypothetical protein
MMEAETVSEMQEMHFIMIWLIAQDVIAFSLCEILQTPIDGCEWSASLSDCIISEKKSWYQLDRTVGGPGANIDVVAKKTSLPQLEIKLQLSKP